MASLQEEFTEFKRGRHRISPLQGTGVETQRLPNVGNTGAGGILGSIAGTVGTFALTKSKAKAEAGGAALATIGDLLETGIQQAIDPTREVSIGGAAKSALTQGALSLVGGAVGHGAVKTFNVSKQFLGQHLKFFEKKVTPEAQQVIDLLDAKAKEFGIPILTLSERTDFPLLDIAQNISNNAIFGVRGAQNFARDRGSIINTTLEAFRPMLDKVTNPRQLGNLLVSLAKGNAKIDKAPAKILLNTVEHNVREAGLNSSVKRLRAWAKGEIIQSAKTGKLGDAIQGTPTARKVEVATRQKLPKIKDLGTLTGESSPAFRVEIGDDVLIGSFDELSTVVANLPNTKPVADLMSMKRSALALQRSISVSKKLKNSPAAAKINTLVSLLDESIEAGLSQPGADPAMRAMWREGNKLFRQSSTRFSNAILNDLVRSMSAKIGGNPAGLVRAIVKSEEDGAFNLIRAAKTAMDPKNIGTRQWVQVQQGIVEHFLKESWDPVLKTYDGTKLAKFFSGKDSMSKATLEKALGTERTTGMLKFAEALETIQLKSTKNPVNIGKLGIQFVQIGAASGAFAGDLDATAGAILLGPALLGKMLRSRKTIALLTKGIQTKISDPKWPALFSRIIAQLSIQQSSASDTDPLASQRALASIDEREATTMGSLMRSILPSGPQLTR